MALDTTTASGVHYSAQSESVSFRKLASDIPSTRYATFALYRYVAKFIPHVVSYALKQFGSTGESVLDPFAGYGTVGTVARTQRNPYELWDLNPCDAHIPLPIHYGASGR